MTIYVGAGLRFHSDLISNIRSCLHVVAFIRYFLEEVLCYFRPLVHCSKGAAKLLEGLLQDCEQFPMKSPP